MIAIHFALDLPVELIAFVAEIYLFLVGVIIVSFSGPRAANLAFFSIQFIYTLAMKANTAIITCDKDVTCVTRIFIGAVFGTFTSFSHAFFA